ncbi:MAG: hypothetical protein K2H92_07150 [Bacteroidaceae bacterium]|nr:hypothetical protein [Bacteroidaceae bacterium]
MPTEKKRKNWHKSVPAHGAQKEPPNRSPRLRPTDVPDSDWSESGTSI